MQKKTGSLCPLPWLHISADFNEDLRLCCNAALEREVTDAQGEVIKLSDVEDFGHFLNKSSLASVRKEMMQGNLPTACSSCEKIDGSGGISPRQHNLNQYQDIFGELLAATDEEGIIHHELPGPKFLDMSLGNSCNFKCRMCSPVFSSSLMPIFDKLNLGLEDQYDRSKVLSVRERWIFDERQEKVIKKWLPHMDKIMIQGGEPFITAQVWKFLEWAVETGDAGHIYLKLATNLSSLPADKLNTLAQFKGVHFHVSLEGTKPFNDYIRQGSEWEKVTANLDKLMQMKKLYPFSFNIHTVLQAYNLSDTLDFIRWSEEKWGMWPTFGLLYYPDFLSAQILPQKYKEEQCSKIEKYLDAHIAQLAGKDLVNAQTLRAHMEFILKPIEYRDFLWARFCSYTAGLDQHFHTSWQDLVGTIDD